jgi:hypothetical protein
MTIAIAMATPAHVSNEEILKATLDSLPEQLRARVVSARVVSIDVTPRSFHASLRHHAGNKVRGACQLRSHSQKRRPAVFRN